MSNKHSINELSYFLKCSNINKQIDKEQVLYWETFYISNTSGLSIERYIAYLSSVILFSLLDDAKGIENVGPSENLTKEQYFFNQKLYSRFPPTDTIVQLASTAWLRVVGIYNKIVEISTNYDIFAPLLEGNKRIGKTDSYINFTIPGLFAKTVDGNKEYSLLNILPHNISTHQNQIFNINNCFTLDFLKQSEIYPRYIHNIEYNIDQINKDFNYSELIITKNIYQMTDRLINNLTFNESFPKFYNCFNCYYKNQCNFLDIKDKQNL